ncbi:MAG: hypothetical protein L0Z68_05600 [Gammaproteobacteria bacterium]|nr:hypothetical protein [Gammaproteobacteria bacterium]
MQLDLQALLPRLLPHAIAWAEAVAADVAATGTALNARDLAIASAVEVQRPENIRVLMVDRLPLPPDPELQAAAVQTGLLGPTMTGLTLGYSILICHGHMSRRLLSHECRHVFQFERAGSIASFLPAYLGSIVQVGYGNCPFEQDARAHELSDA